MTAEIIPFQGPRELASIAARLPVLFLGTKNLTALLGVFHRQHPQPEHSARIL
jgi:hypothetical protein